MLRAKLPVLWATLETLKNWPHHSSVSMLPLAPNPTNNSGQNKLSLCYKSITHTALSCFCGCLRHYTPSHTLHSASDTHSLTVPHTKFDSHPPDSSHQTVHCWFPRLFCFQSSPSSPTETLSGLLQIEPHDISFSKTTDLPCFQFHTVVFLCLKSVWCPFECKLSFA